jgi:hypothetical protein
MCLDKGKEKSAPMFCNCKQREWENLNPPPPPIVASDTLKKITL